LTLAIACDASSGATFLLFGISVWLASQHQQDDDDEREERAAEEAIHNGSSIRVAKWMFPGLHVDVPRVIGITLP